MCFTGHRELPEDSVLPLSHRLDQVLAKLYHFGYRRFYCGGALGFDQLAAERVLALKALHEDACLVMAIPCADQRASWSEEEQIRYRQLLALADEVHVLSPHYYPGCMMTRNRFMVDRSAFCLCYLEHFKGGTMSTVAYANREHLAMLNLAMADRCSAFLRKRKAPHVPLLEEL